MYVTYGFDPTRPYRPLGSGTCYIIGVVAPMHRYRNVAEHTVHISYPTQLSNKQLPDCAAASASWQRGDCFRCQTAQRSRIPCVTPPPPALVQPVAPSSRLPWSCSFELTEARSGQVDQSEVDDNVRALVLVDRSVVEYFVARAGGGGLAALAAGRDAHQRPSIHSRSSSSRVRRRRRRRRVILSQGEGGRRRSSGKVAVRDLEVHEIGCGWS
eukprot:COSAG06_NODE_10127_length_1744_cov_8.285106_2_plen_213_part_00